ncbi:MoaD/ThiS family protein [bacterium]|nr:MoaD/ThiS family protein [bacterium]
MITVKLYGLYRLKAENPVYEINKVKTLADALVKLELATNVSVKEWEKAVIYINGVAIDKLKMFKSKLKDGDEVAILSPASGG